MSLSDVSRSAPLSRVLLRQDLLASLRENSPLLLFSFLFGLAPFFVAEFFSISVVPYTEIGLTYLGLLATEALVLFAAFALWYLYHTRVLKIRDFQTQAWQRIKNDFLRRERLLLALPIMAVWPITASAFSYLKSVMQLIQPFHLDAALYQWDHILHFGIDPWRLLQPLLGHTWITYAINLGYAMWFFVLQATLVLQSAAIGDRRRRLQFLLTMALAWALIGNLAATLMSSAGPCYFALVAGGPNPYAPLMAYLRDVADNLSVGAFGYELHIPFGAGALQGLLWESYVNGDYGMAMGISAAPSLHIASSWIIARLTWSMGRKAAICGSAFLAFIFVGSIHLGWHYAVDGYLAVAGAWALWRLVGWGLDRPAVRRLLWPDAAQPAVRG
ncbi:MAG: phosphatase PAP2 family protein [Dongiaceae bacterium]